MKDRIRTLFANESFREKFLYLVVGGLTTLVNTVVHFLFIKLVSSACSIRSCASTPASSRELNVRSWSSTVKSIRVRSRFAA